MPAPNHPGWRSTPDVIRMAISFAAGGLAQLREASFAILDRLQFTPPPVQMDALFVTAVTMANSLGLDPHEMVVRAKRLIPDVDAFNEQLNAARDYAHGELRQ